MKTKYNKRRFKTLIMIIILLLCMSIGYAYLSATLNIEGTSNIKSNTWDVHWENVSVKGGSVTGDQVPIAAHILTDTTQVEYSVTLKNPGDYYEFTVDAKNAGSLDAMVSVVDTKFYEANGVTQISLPNYLEYSFTYDDDLPVLQNQILEANQKEKLKVKIKFKDNLEESELPTTDKTIIVRHNIVYVQSDENSTPVRTYFYTSIGSNKCDSPEEAMMSSGFPFFMKYVAAGFLEHPTDVGFRANGNIYYLKGNETETNSPTHPVFDENKATLLETFGNNNCTTGITDFSGEEYITCSDSNLNLNAYAYTGGTVGVRRELNVCIISSSMAVFLVDVSLEEQV